MKCFIITKKQLMLCICFILALTVAAVGSLNTFAGTERLLPIYCVETDKKQVAISFDAAWGKDKKVQNASNPHNNWICASPIFLKNPILLFSHHFFKKFRSPQNVATFTFKNNKIFDNCITYLLMEKHTSPR